MENKLLHPLLKNRKVSEVFMEYVEPFLNALLLDRAQKGIYDAPNIQELENVLRMPWGIWNAIIAESVSNNEINFLQSIDMLSKHMPSSIKGLLEMMKKRKRIDFEQYQYYLGDYQVYYDQNNELRIKVEATSPNTSK
ncbi:MAG TPA: hypothetical protein PK583_01190 [Gammaproteobacteria bacterium]|nr:hypothetical protein [Gammaproteobacteria bacterium]HRA43358.1 hypothetical protein [Gammaproteobacteria bacterium]